MIGVECDGGFVLVIGKHIKSHILQYLIIIIYFIIILMIEELHTDLQRFTHSEFFCELLPKHREKARYLCETLNRGLSFIKATSTTIRSMR